MPSLELVVISLTSSNDRRAMVSARLSQLPWPWRFFDARTAADNTLPYEPERAAIRRGYRLASAEIGCFVSHFECLREYAYSPASAPEFMIVLEDDVVLDDDYDFEVLAALMSALDIHYLKLFSRFMTRVRFLGRLGQRGLYRFVVPPYGNQAYVVSKIGARRLADSIRRIDRPIDDEMDRYWVNALPTYALFPYPARELNMQSTIIKGFTDVSGGSLVQKLRSAAFNWADKIPREYANLRFTSRDLALGKKISHIQTHGNV